MRILRKQIRNFQHHGRALEWTRHTLTPEYRSFFHISFDFKSNLGIDKTYYMHRQKKINIIMIWENGREIII